MEKNRKINNRGKGAGGDDYSALESIHDVGVEREKYFWWFLLGITPYEFFKTAKDF